MKNILLTLFIAISINSFGQEWTDLKVDSVLTLKLPDNYHIYDTLGIKVFTGILENAVVSVSIGENVKTVKDEKLLLVWYNSFKESSVKANHGQLIKDQIIEAGGLKMIRFSFHMEKDGEKKVKHSIVAVVNNKFYTISFTEAESPSGEMEKTREKFFSSMKFPPGLGLNNQLSAKDRDEMAYNQGELLGKITVGLLIGLAVWFSTRRKKKDRPTSAVR
ncbi:MULTISPECIES: hypothetical protein [Niastella]|uniref:DUF4468 domain-containing protein n=1 Tax=Niastella soli TaxID=2821487 RepID=A0ABS3YXE2_9BACT|nr:hypothetical protein [Niastella soli]MBO9202548.1 hypothetical protein [Niastella soli]